MKLAVCAWPTARSVLMAMTIEENIAEVMDIVAGYT